jgi:DHA1 family bicyclomycin/chloramphenicol resistance-like MFS transporter
MAAILAALAAVAPFSIDAYLPAFPDIAAALATSSLEVQQTLTAYMGTFAVMVLWHGALADRFGRRKVLFAAMGLYALASVVCAAAMSIEWLWVGRALQGMSGGAGMVVGRAVIRDLYEGAHAQRLMSRVMLIFGIAPAIAPVIGGALLALAGWRSIFVFLAVLGGLLVYLVWRFLPETLAPESRQELHPVKLARAYAEVLGSLGFLLLAVAVAFNFNGFFVYVLSAPVFLIDHLGLSSQGFGWLFMPAVAGMMMGSVMSGRVAGRWSQKRAIGVGFAIMMAAAMLNVLVSSLLVPGLPWSVAPVALYNVGMALAMPSLTLLALDLFPARRGLASSCQSFIQVGLNSLTAGLLAPILWFSPFTLAAGMTAFLAFGLLAFCLWRSKFGATG